VEILSPLKSTLILVVWLCRFFVEIILLDSKTFKHLTTVLSQTLDAVEICDTEILSSVLFQPHVFLMMAISTENSDGFNSFWYLSKIEFGIGIYPSFMYVKIYFVVVWKTTKLKTLSQKLMEDA